MISTVKTFSGRALRTGRDPHGEPLLFNDNILSQMNDLVASLNPGDEIRIEKVYLDDSFLEARLLITNEHTIIKSGNLPLTYCMLSSELKGWELAADISSGRSKIKTVTISVT